MTHQNKEFCKNKKNILRCFHNNSGRTNFNIPELCRKLVTKLLYHTSTTLELLALVGKLTWESLVSLTCIYYNWLSRDSTLKNALLSVIEQRKSQQTIALRYTMALHCFWKHRKEKKRTEKIRSPRELNASPALDVLPPDVPPVTARSLDLVGRDHIVLTNTVPVKRSAFGCRSGELDWYTYCSRSDVASYNPNTANINHFGKWLCCKHIFCGAKLHPAATSTSPLAVKRTGSSVGRYD